MDLKGLPVTFLDTAGLRATSDEIEGLGIERALKRAETADLRVILTDNGALPPALQAQPDDIVRLGKADLSDGTGVSGLTGAGVDVLINEVVAVLETKASGASLAIRARHREALETGAASLRSVQSWRLKSCGSPFGRLKLW